MGKCNCGKKIQLKTITEVPEVIDLYGGTDEFYTKFNNLGKMYTEDLQPCTKCGVQQKNYIEEVRINLTTEPLDFFLRDTSVF